MKSKLCSRTAAVFLFSLHLVTTTGVREGCWESGSSAEAVRRGELAAAPPPSEATPFLFLHVPKTGGSTIRGQLVAASKRLGIGGERLSPVGGHQPRHELYDHKVGPRQARDAALLAGHLTWGTLSRMQLEFQRFEDPRQRRLRPLPPSQQDQQNRFTPKISTAATTTAAASAATALRCDPEETASSTGSEAFAASTPKFTCLTLLRHPLDRTISYYYNRIAKNGPPLSSLSPQDLREQLLAFRKDGSKRFSGNSDEGPLQPTFKMLCGNWSANGNKWATAECGLPIARRRLRHCFVGVIDEWLPNSCAVLAAQLPWLQLNCSVHENDHRSSPQSLKEAAAVVLATSKKKKAKAATKSVAQLSAAAAAAAAADEDGDEEATFGKGEDAEGSVSGGSRDNSSLEKKPTRTAKKKKINEKNGKNNGYRGIDVSSAREQPPPLDGGSAGLSQQHQQQQQQQQQRHRRQRKPATEQISDDSPRHHHRRLRVSKRGDPAADAAYAAYHDDTRNVDVVAAAAGEEEEEEEEEVEEKWDISTQKKTLRIEKNKKAKKKVEKKGKEVTAAAAVALTSSSGSSLLPGAGAGASGHETRHTLPAALAQVIMDLNRDEMVLYQDALRLVAQDTKTLRRGHSTKPTAKQQMPEVSTRKKKIEKKDTLPPVAAAATTMAAVKETAVATKENANSHV